MADNRTPGPSLQDASRTERAAGRVDPFAILVGLFLCLALGAGGSSADPVSAAIARLSGLPVLTWAACRLVRRPIPPGALWPLIIMLAAVLLVAAQLIPLPPDIWRSLPGRRTVAEGFTAAGLAAPWLTVSLTPQATLYEGLGLIPPAAVFLAVLTLEAGARRALAAIVLVMAVASVSLGMMQVSQGPDSPLRLYADTNPESAVGFFANRNHQAAFLALTLPLAAFLATRRSAGGGPRAVLWSAVAAGFALIVAVGAGVTGSRAGAVLIVLGGLGAAAVAARVLARSAGSHAAWAPVAALAVAILAAGGLVAVSGDAVLAGRLQERFGDDLRLELNPAVARAGLAFAPVGSGLGSFVDVYPMFESRLTLGPSYVNHAHNDFLEIWLECGVPGIALVVGFLVWWVGATVSLSRDPRARETPLALAGSIVVAMLLVHSAVDYPLRTPALATLFGLACGWLVRGAASPPARP